MTFCVGLNKNWIEQIVLNLQKCLKKFEGKNNTKTFEN